jgi:hypothetical protein
MNSTVTTKEASLTLVWWPFNMAFQFVAFDHTFSTLVALQLLFFSSTWPFILWLWPFIFNIGGLPLFPNLSFHLQG